VIDITSRSKRQRWARRRSVSMPRACTRSSRLRPHGHVPRGSMAMDDIMTSVRHRDLLVGQWRIRCGM